MAKVERQLKVNAIDCFLNKNGNIFPNVIPTIMHKPTHRLRFLPNKL